MTLGEGDVISSANPHKCIADMAKVEVLKCKVNCKKRAREELTCAPKIFEEEFAEATNMGLDFVCTMQRSLDLSRACTGHEEKHWEYHSTSTQ